MKSKISGVLIKENKPAKLTSRRYYSVGTFLICLLIAGFSWVLTSLAKNYHYRIRQAVVFNNLPEGKILTNNLPNEFYLDVNAPGFVLLSHLLKGKRQVINLDLKTLAPSVDELGVSEIKISHTILQKEIDAQMNSNIIINSTEPEFIYLNFKSEKFKKVPVLLMLKYSFSKDCDLSGSIHLNEDSVLAFGPEDVLKNLNAIETEKRVLNSISETKNYSFSLISPKNISLQHNKVLVTIPVERFTSSSVEIPIEARNIPAGSRIRIIPSKVKITYLVSMKDFNKISVEDFKAIVDLTDTKNTASGKSSVILKNSPASIKNIKFTPREVEYLLINH